LKATFIVFITNEKLHMSFQLAPKSVTLNDCEQHNGPYLHYFAESGSFWGRLCQSGWR